MFVNCTHGVKKIALLSGKVQVPLVTATDGPVHFSVLLWCSAFTMRQTMTIFLLVCAIATFLGFSFEYCTKPN